MRAIIHKHPRLLSLTLGGSWMLEQIFWVDTSQTTLFETVSCHSSRLASYTPRALLSITLTLPLQTSKPLVDYALKGINSCCFAYGQTGSGKTFRWEHVCSCCEEVANFVCDRQQLTSP